MVNDIAVQEFVNAIKEPPQDTNNTYGATVSRIDDEGIVWVNIHGSDKETPTASTSTEVKRGDAVTVSWRNNKLYIGGNYSNPSAGMSTVMPSVDYVTELIDKDVTVTNINAATGYIGELEAQNIKAEDISADHATIKELDVESMAVATAYIRELTADDITAEDIATDHATIGSLDTNYAKINAANVTDLSAQNAWVNKIMVQTGLLAHEGTVFTLDAIQVNAANITAGTIDVNRLIVTVNGEKYLVEIDPTTHQPSYEKLDGGIVEPRTITADKIVAHDITVQEITTENLVGTNGWINLNQGKFFYTTNGSTWANTTNGIMWDGTSLKIKGDVDITSSSTIYTKTQVDAANAKYATCSTGGSTTAKVATISPTVTGWTRTTGSIITVKFSNANTATTPTLNVNSTGAATIKSYTGAALAEAEYKWAADATLTFVFDGTYWRLQDSGSTAQIKVNADNINLKVAKNDVINQINVSTEGAQIQASKVDIAGAAVFNNYSTTTEMNTAIGNAVDGIEVGGRNMLLDTDAPKTFTITLNSSNYIAVSCYKTYAPVPSIFSVDDLVTISFDWSTTATDGNFRIECGNVTPWTWGTVINAIGTRSSTSQITDITSSNTSGHIIATFKITSSQTSATSELQWLRIRVDGANTNGKTFTVSNAKAERGNKATDWTPAPEDVQAEIDAKKSVHTLMSSSTTGSTYANILTWTTEGRQNSTWGVDTTATPLTDVKIGDTCRLAYKVSDMGGAYVYVVGEVTAFNDARTSVTMTMHGLDTTIIDGGNILTNSIGANQIAANSIGAKHLTISDSTNLATANEMYESSLPPYSQRTAIENGYLVKETATQQYLMVTDFTANGFKANDELYYEFYGKAATAGSVSLSVWGYTGTPPTHTNHISKGVSIALTTSEAFYSGTLELSDAKWTTATQYIIGFTDGRSTKSQIYIRKLIIRRKNGGELIVDGAITADKLDATTINASNKLTVGSMTSAAQDSILNSKVSDAMNGYTIIWDKNYGASSAGGEALITKYDPLTNQVTLNTAGWVMWNGTKRTVPSTEYNPNSMVPYNIPVYLVLRLTSSTATTGTVYPVWYASSKWNYLQLGANAATTDNAVADWTWVEATDIVLGSCVEPASETIFTDCQIYDPPWTCKQVTSNTVTAQSAQTTANTANNRAVAYRGTCSTAAGTAAKVVTCSNFSLVTGAVITVYFSTANTVVASGITLNVNNTGAKNIQYSSSGTTSSVARLMWDAGATMTFVYDGTQYRLEDNVRTRSAHVGQTGNTANVTGKPWYKFASVVAYATNTDYYATFRVECYPSNDRTGVLKVRIRTDGSSYITPSSCAIYWDSLSNNMATHLTDFVIAYKASTANSTVELWCKVAEAWGSYNFTLLSESTRVQTDTANWTLYYQHTDGGSAAVTSGYTTIASTTKTAYITHIDNNGIRIHPSSTENNSVVIKADGMEVFKGGTTDAYSVAKYSDTVRIGKPSGASRIELDYHSLQLIAKEGLPYFWVSDLRESDGLATVTDIFYGDGSEKYFAFSSPGSTSTMEVLSVTVDGTSVSYTTSQLWVTLNTAPAQGKEVRVTYKTDYVLVQAFTFGDRADSTIGPQSFTSGYNCKAEGFCSSAFGLNAEATGLGSFAAGNDAWAHGEGCCAIGRGVVAHDGQFVCGRNNVEDTDYAYSFIVGDGIGSIRSTAFTVGKDGDATVHGGDIVINFNNDTSSGTDYEFLQAVSACGWSVNA